MPQDVERWHIGLVGYGEVGRILAEDLRAQGIAVSACDAALGSAQGEAMREHAQRFGVRLHDSHGALAASSDLVVSAVTASQTVAAAEACAPGMQRGAWFLDFNSASPGAKRRAAAVIDAAGGRYVEAAVMASIPPPRIRVPMLLGGNGAAELAPLLGALGFNATVARDALGVASAVKMCRSVVVKGFEAMVIESFTAARSHGVEDQVIASLRQTFPGIDWEQQATYFFQRVIEHGRRRAEEMREAAQTVREAGLDAGSATGTAQAQGWIADLADHGVFGQRGESQFARDTDWRAAADRILRSRKPGQST